MYHRLHISNESYDLNMNVYDHWPFVNIECQELKFVKILKHFRKESIRIIAIKFTSLILYPHIKLAYIKSTLMVNFIPSRILIYILEHLPALS